MPYQARVGVFLTSRIATPSPVERQCGLEIQHKTAPDESAAAKDVLPACRSETEIPLPGPREMFTPLNASVFLFNWGICFSISPGCLGGEIE